MTNVILVINAGSSSLKFALHPATTNVQGALLKGQIEGIGGTPRFHALAHDGAPLLEQTLPTGSSAETCLSHLMHWLESRLGTYQLVGAGHRVVHGGEHLATPMLISDAIVAKLEKLVPLARAHQPFQIAAIKALATFHPSLNQVACFDTMFHMQRPRLDKIMAIPRALTDAGILRYGFHGLSYEYIASCLPEILGDKASGKIIVAHLGSGASLCAMLDLRCVATTMGFTALDGLMMGTRCGAIDPGVLLYAMEERGMSATQLSAMLYQKSGLLGVSGISSDMRTLLADNNPNAQEAVELFVASALREIGKMMAALEGLDALVFTAGIGERSPEIRAMICNKLAWVGVAMNSSANTANEIVISAPESRVTVCAIPTNEELIIARHTSKLLKW